MPTETHASHPVVMRRATLADLPRIVQMLADDALGATRERFEDPLPTAYLDAFAAIEADPNQFLLVAEVSGTVVGVLQLTFIPGLTRLGSWRAMIEGVRVDGSQRGAGIGQQMVTWAIEEARRRSCRLVQLTTDKSRLDAHRFYERLGFVATHEGMKLDLRVEG
jgi:ribosomal protein S18 acetylase RimI-like enzyme